MEQIFEWTAKRAGGHITIYGKGTGGNPRRITKVDYITLEQQGPVAVDKDGNRYALAQRDYAGRA